MKAYRRGGGLAIVLHQNETGDSWLAETIADGQRWLRFGWSEEKRQLRCRTPKGFTRGLELVPGRGWRLGRLRS